MGVPDLPGVALLGGQARVEQPLDRFDPVGPAIAVAALSGVGRALMIKAGASGSGISDVVCMGMW